MEATGCGGGGGRVGRLGSLGREGRWTPGSHPGHVLCAPGRNGWPQPHDALWLGRLAPPPTPAQARAGVFTAAANMPSPSRHRPPPPGCPGSQTPILLGSKVRGTVEWGCCRSGVRGTGTSREWRYPGSQPCLILTPLLSKSGSEIPLQVQHHLCAAEQGSPCTQPQCSTPDPAASQQPHRTSLTACPRASRILGALLYPVPMPHPRAYCISTASKHQPSSLPTSTQPHPRVPVIPSPQGTPEPDYPSSGSPTPTVAPQPLQPHPQPAALPQ